MTKSKRTLTTLAAAVIGRMERLPTIAIAAIGIGMIDQAMTFQPGNRAARAESVAWHASPSNSGTSVSRCTTTKRGSPS